MKRKADLHVTFSQVGFLIVATLASGTVNCVYTGEQMFARGQPPNASVPAVLPQFTPPTALEG